MLMYLRAWYRSISSKCDPLELEQAVIRLPAVLLLLGLVRFSYLNESVVTPEFLAYQIIFGYACFSILLTLAIIKNKSNPVYRRLAGAWLDIGGASVFMAFTSDVGVMLVAFDLWAIFGNGFRFGKKYLYHAQFLSIAGFFIATNVNDYWEHHETIGLSLLLMLIALPLYVAKLITRLKEALNKAEIASGRAAEASLAKTRFVANMSHEIRTPLNGIIGISTLIKTTPLNEDQQDLIKTLESSSKLLLSLLNNVLDFTKIEERKFTVENVAFSLEEVVTDTLEIFQVQANTKGIQLGVSISKSLNMLKGDAFVLRQVLANLMGNAVKFTQLGSITLSATTLNETKDNLTIRLEITDTGIGIALDKQSKIFDSFTQADASTTRNFGGSGLGLTIAKHMIEEMGSQLMLHSTEGVGSRFWFDVVLEKNIAIELDKNKETDKPIIAKLESISTHTDEITTKLLKILVCEDDGTNQKILFRLLSLPGHQVALTKNADELLDALEMNQFDLVITDLNMGGMNGIDAIKLYRFTQPHDKKTRFMLFTADASLVARQASNDAGFDAFLAKPVDAFTLFNTIENVLGLPTHSNTQWLKHSYTRPNDPIATSNLFHLTLDLNTLKELENIGAGDDLFIHRLLVNYLSDSSKIIRSIEASVKLKRYGEIYDQCHALKGNSLSVGAIELVETIETISKFDASISATESANMLRNLHSDFAKVSIAIENYLRQPEVVTRQE